jgi:transcriptional regulator
MGNRVEKVIEKIADLAVESASHIFFCEPDIPAQLLEQSSEHKETEVEKNV